MALGVAEVAPRTARIFLSYKRNVEPDQALAHDVVANLSSAGHCVFIDQRLIVGQAWAEEIEKQVRQSDYLIVFLTAESSRSEMVRGEIEIARHHAAINGSPRILPVRLAFDGPLPYPLNAYLDKIQYAVWSGGEDTPRLIRELLDVVGCDASPESGSREPSSIDVGQRPPAYAAPLPVPGGTLDVDDPWYLARPTDATALALIRQPGQTLTIKGPRQMGKSSLLMRTISAGLDLGKSVALLDFQLVDEDGKANADLFFRRAVAPVYLDLTKTLLQASEMVTDAAARRQLLLDARETIERLKAAELRDYFRDECIADLQNRTRSPESVAPQTAVVYPILLPDRLELLVTLHRISSRCSAAGTTGGPTRRGAAGRNSTSSCRRLQNRSSSSTARMNRRSTSG